MNQSRGLSQFQRRVEVQFGLNQGLLLVVGLGCLARGVLSGWLPMSLYGLLVWITGALLLWSGAIKSSQLLLRGRSEATRHRAWLLIVAQILLDVPLNLLRLIH